MSSSATQSTFPIELFFLGSGTSAGVPMIGCHCDVCTSKDPRDHRSRPSVIIEYEKTRVLIDTTPELRMQAISNGIDRIDALVYTHAHADHLMGLDDVRRFNMVKDGPIDTWADPATFEAINRCFYYAFKHPDEPLVGFRPHLVKKLIEGPFEIAGRPWLPVPLLHAGGSVLGFRIGALAYCTDVSDIPDASYELLKGVEVLVIGALGLKPHPAHFSVDQAIVASRRIGAGRTYFTHIGHSIKHADVQPSLPPNVFLGYDGLRIIAGK